MCSRVKKQGRRSNSSCTSLPVNNINESASYGLNLYNFCASNIDRVIYELMDCDRFRFLFFSVSLGRRKIRKISITFPFPPPLFYFPQNCIRFYK